MSATSEEINKLISSFTELKNYFEKVRDAIDEDRAQMKADLQAHIDSADSRIALPPNLIKNAFMQEVENGVPKGFTGNGLKIEAVHPFTHGFEGPYVSECPANATDDPTQATKDKPYWYGKYNMGPRVGRGGLSTGWGQGSIANGHILKTTAEIGAADEHRMIRFTAQRLAAHDKLWFRCYVKIVRGSKIGFGHDSGHKGIARGLTVTKAQCDAAEQGWLKVDKLISTSRIVRSVGKNSFTVGANVNEDVEFYLALPYAYIPHNAEMGIVE